VASVVRSCPVAVAVLFATLLAAVHSARAGEPAAAVSDPLAASTAKLALAEAEDARGDYAHAAADYRAAIAILPSSRYAAKATMRAALLEAHSEGDWRPFARLEEVRHDPNLSSDPQAIDALAGAADDFPPGPTRGEARLLCADAYLSRLHRRADGERTLRQVVGDPSTDDLVRRQAASQLVGAYIADGDLDAAEGLVATLGHTIDGLTASRVRALLRRRRVHAGAIVDLVAFALLASVAVTRAALGGGLGGVARALRPTLLVALGFGLYLGMAGAWLASSFEQGTAAPFWGFALALVPIAVVARAWSAAGSTSTAARAVRAIVSGSAVVATAFLTLEIVNAQFLDGFYL
jgi:hypothetical protein